MTGRLPDRAEISAVVDHAADATRNYFEGLDERLVRSPNFEKSLERFRGPLPESGDGALSAIRELTDFGMDAIVNAAGPRFYHFVCGGATPAALGGELLAGAFDQNAYTWFQAPLAVELEMTSINWLKELFGLPKTWTGLMVTGATMCNYVSLGAARQWWGHGHGVNVAEQGMHGMPPVPVFTSGYVHASSVKVMSMLGLGRSAMQKFSRDKRGRVDLPAIEAELKALNGKPAILIANAGEVNAGDFDPVDAFADLAERYNCWLHVDGAFGLFAAVSPRTRHLTKGIERAHSVTVDGHKWLNVPYDCGFALVSDQDLLAETFAYSADYLPDADDPTVTFGAIGPESSRRARSLAVWATLKAYGRSGIRHVVESHLDLAQYLAEKVDAAPDLERLADVQLNIVCFRYNPGGLSDKQLDVLNAKLGDAILEDGRVYAGTTQFEGRTALRPALVNWRIRNEDIDLFVDVVRELGERLT